MGFRVPHLRDGFIVAKVGSNRVPLPSRQVRDRWDAYPRSCHSGAAPMSCHSERCEESPHFAFACSRSPSSFLGTPRLQPWPSQAEQKKRGWKPEALASGLPWGMQLFNLQKSQQIRMSSPSTPQNPHNSHSINHFPPKNSWHTSYAPLDTLNIWIKSIEGQLRPRGNKPPPPARTALSQPNKPPLKSSFWRSQNLFPPPIRM